MIVGASCTAELIQDDPGGLAEALGLPCPVIPLELPSYSRKENFGADETFFQIVKALAKPLARTEAVTCNLIGPTALGFRHRDDVTELTRAAQCDGHRGQRLRAAGCDARRHRPPWGRAFQRADVSRNGRDRRAASWKRRWNQPFTKVVPIGTGATRDFLAEVATITGLPLPTKPACASPGMRHRSIPPTLPASASTSSATAPMPSPPPGSPQRRSGSRWWASGLLQPRTGPPLRAAAKTYGLEALITDDYLEVEAEIARLQPELILGTQMERHIAKRLGIPCAVISAPVHVQDFPARYSPRWGTKART
jgi:light-independent protochlorophyllide reductase subunit B